jgi:lysozyme
MLCFMRASPELIDYLKRREEFAATPYLDAAGKWTIGYGHVIRHHEKRTLTYLTEPQGELLLDQDCDPVELYLSAIMPRFDKPLNQHQFDALVSLAFNIGLRAFEESTLLRLLRCANFVGAALEFDRWIYITKTGPDGTTRKLRSRGLMNRRKMDRAVFEWGIYA